MKRSPRRLTVWSLLLAMAATACAGAASSAPGERTPSPSDPGSLLLQVATGGGFVSPTVTLRQVPEFTLTSGGQLITVGPQIEIYPGPALPNLLVREIAPAGVRAIIGAARRAGLDGPNRSYDGQPISDAPTTTFTFLDGGRVHTISVYALDFDGRTTGGVVSDSSEAKARRALSDLRNRLFDLEIWLPSGSMGPERSYEIQSLRVYVQPFVRTDGVREQTVVWPLATGLERFGSRAASAPGLRCGVVDGQDSRWLVAQLQKANELTPWRSGGKRWSLIVRPLLPGESGC